MRRTVYFSVFILTATVLLAGLLLHGALSAEPGQLAAKRQLVQSLALTDLSIWSEARYTRHPSQADLFTAFQDYPGAFDHFPAGSILSPVAPQLDTSLSFQKSGSP